MVTLLHAPAYTATALAQREQFIRGAAEAWRRAGNAITADRLVREADGLVDRLRSSSTCALVGGTSDNH